MNIKIYEKNQRIFDDISSENAIFEINIKIIKLSLGSK